MKTSGSPHLTEAGSEPRTHMHAYLIVCNPWKTYIHVFDERVKDHDGIQSVYLKSTTHYNVLKCSTSTPFPITGLYLQPTPKDT